MNSRSITHRFISVERVQLDLWLPSSRYYRPHRVWVQLEQLMLLQDVHPEAQDVVAVWICQPLLHPLARGMVTLRPFNARPYRMEATRNLMAT